MKMIAVYEINTKYLYIPNSVLLHAPQIKKMNIPHSFGFIFAQDSTWIE